MYALHCLLLRRAVTAKGSWRDDIPRIVENIPRRLPRRLAEYSDYAMSELMKYSFPKASALEAGTESDSFGWGWPVWIALALLAAFVYEAGRFTAIIWQNVRESVQQGTGQLPHYKMHAAARKSNTQSAAFAHRPTWRLQLCSEHSAAMLQVMTIEVRKTLSSESLTNNIQKFCKGRQ